VDGEAEFSLVLDCYRLHISLASVDWYHSTYSTSNIIGTETSSQVTDRGIYTNDTVNGYVWGYDSPQYPGETAEAWVAVLLCPAVGLPAASAGQGSIIAAEPTTYGWP